MQHILRINWDELNRFHVKIIGTLLYSPDYFKETFFIILTGFLDIEVRAHKSTGTTTPSVEERVIKIVSLDCRKIFDGGIIRVQ